MIVAGVLVRHAGDSLRELFPSGPVCERTFVPVAVDRYYDDAGTHLRQFFRSEAAAGESARTVSLREYVRIASQRAQSLDVCLAFEIEKARTLAGIGIDDEGLDGRELGTSHVQHFGAVLGESPRAGRSGEHAREIENAHARKWASAMLAGARSGERLWLCVAEAKNLDYRHLRERDALRMRAPLVAASQLRTAYSPLGERIFKRLRIPRRDGIRDRAGVIVALQKRERPFARTEPSVQMNPSSVTSSIESGRGLRAAVERSALTSLIEERHERCGCGAHVHLDTLRTPAARAPKVGRRGRIRGEDSSGSLAGAKTGCDNGIVSDYLERVLIRGVLASE